MKKSLSFFLCAVMLASVLSGCAKKDESTTPNTNGGTSSVGTEAAKPIDKIDLSTKPTLKLLMPYTPFDPNADVTAKYLEQATGYKVQYDILPNEDAQTKLNAIIASKTEYDIIVLTKADFSNTVSTGAYDDLNDLLPVYGADIQAKTDEGLWTNVTIGGKIKAIPEGMASENAGLSHRVRVDLLKKAGIETMPTTIDEFYNACKAIKEKLGIIPLSSSAAFIPEIASAFGLYVDGSNKFSVIDNKVVYQAAVPGAKAYVEFMNKMFTEGLLDNEFAQNTGDVMKEKFFTSKTAMYQIGWWNEPGAYTTIMEKAPTAEVAYLPPLKGADGTSGLSLGRGVNRMTVIPKVSKNKEHALNYINLKLDDEIFKVTNMGEENVHYKTLADGSYEPILPKFFEDKNNASFYLTGSDTATYSLYWSQTRVKKDPILYKEFNLIQDNAKLATQHYDPTTFMQPNKAFSDSISKVNKLTDDTFKQFITGTKPMSEWDSFLSELNAAGLSEIDKTVSEWWAVEGPAIADKMVRK